MNDQSPTGPASWPVVSQQQLFDCRVLRLAELVCRSPKDGLDHPFVQLQFPAWVNIVAITPQGEWVLVEQFRHGRRDCTLEIPGGMVDKDEEPLLAAQRELEEETGYVSTNWIRLGTVEPNPAIQDNLCHLFLAEGCQKKYDSVARLDSTEDIQIRLFDEESVLAKVQDGTIRHSLVLTAIFFYLCHRDHGLLNR